MRITADELALVTIASGRHEHLRRQLAAVALMDPQPLLHVVVGMGDPELPAVLTGAGPRTRFVGLPTSGRLPLAASRNKGVAEAASHGAVAVALLDVDCIPSKSLAADYATALTTLRPEPGPAVVSGRVRYLPDGLTEGDYESSTLEQLGTDNGLRIVPDTDEPVPGDPHMVWSLNLGVTVEDWSTIGGFDERYEGYGGEDTDFGQRLERAGGTMWWIRNAGAFHQWHPVSRPPVEHIDDIVTNANLFHTIWGWYPMGGWLEEFQRRGLVRQAAHGWHLLP